MKKILASVMAVVLIALTFCGCTQKSGGYKLLSVPKELNIDASVLSENLDENLLNIDEDYMLLCGLPEENLYVYSIHPAVAQGVLVKYDGFIQFFSWSFSAGLAQPDLYVTDYNGDGVKDVAFTYLESVGQTNYNECLHLLLRGDDGFEDYMYMPEKIASDTQSHLVVNKKNADTYTAAVDGKPEDFTMSGYKGELMGLYTKEVQDFTLGEQITVEVNPGLVFEDVQLPVFSVFKYYADVSLVDGVLTQANPKIVF